MGDPSPHRDPTDIEGSLAEAEAASARGDWQTARAVYARLVEGAAAPSGSLLVAWSEALKYTGAFSAALHATERAYRAFVESGDRIDAIRCTTRRTSTEDSAESLDSAGVSKQRFAGGR